MSRIELRRRLFATTGGIALLMSAGTLHAQNLTPDQVLNIANRLTFGATSVVKSEISNNYLQWLDDQLDPDFNQEFSVVDVLLDDNDVPVESVLQPGTSNPGPTSVFRDVQKGVLIYSVHSKFQLAAKMGDFWDRHFNTFINVIFSSYQREFAQLPGGFGTDDAAQLAIRAEWVDYERHRQDGFGSFADLAVATFESPAMALYLDTLANVCAGSPGLTRINENMARELLELHMVGTNYVPTGALNYTAQDIVLLSEAMANWTVERVAGSLPNTFESELQYNPPGAACDLAPASLFGPTLNDPLPWFRRPTLLGPNSVPSIIRHIAGSEACADFICRKLMTEFLGDGTDVTESAILDGMKLQWGVDGDIEAVLRYLFTAPEFMSGKYTYCRARNPLETVAWHVRCWDGDLTDIDYARERMDDLGMPYFQFAAPDGFPLESNEQPASAVSQTSYKMFGDSVYRGLGPQYAFGPFIAQNVPVSQQSDATRVAVALLGNLYGRNFTIVDRNIVRDALLSNVNGVTTPFSRTRPDYLDRVAIGAVSAMTLNQALTR